MVGSEWSAVRGVCLFFESQRWVKTQVVEGITSVAAMFARFRKRSLWFVDAN